MTAASTARVSPASRKPNPRLPATRCRLVTAVSFIAVLLFRRHRRRFLQLRRLTAKVHQRYEEFLRLVTQVAAIHRLYGPTSRTRYLEYQRPSGIGERQASRPPDFNVDSEERFLERHR